MVIMNTLSRNDPCYCGSNKKWKKCHYPLRPKETFYELRKKYKNAHGIILKDKHEIDGIKSACQVTALILDEICKSAVAGTSTSALDLLSQKLHKKHNVIPAPLNYGTPPYPKTICTSINDEICHGIPNETILQNGDIINIDVSCIKNGFFGDSSKMVVIGGKTTKARQTVVDASLACLLAAIDVAQPFNPINSIGSAIHKEATKRGCSVVYDFVAHGIGMSFHEEPQIHHGLNNDTTLLVPGMTFTIEPMINGGLADSKIDDETLWVAKTVDGSPSAQWEHTILITENGNEILTPYLS